MVRSAHTFAPARPARWLHTRSGILLFTLSLWGLVYPARGEQSASETPGPSGSELRIAEMELPAAELNGVNPLPTLLPPVPERSSIAVDGNVPPADREHIGYGLDTRPMPHLMQNQYDRDRRPRKLRVAVLENEHLRATFALDLGGRLW